MNAKSFTPLWNVYWNNNTKYIDNNEPRRQKLKNNKKTRAEILIIISNFALKIHYSISLKKFSHQIFSLCLLHCTKKTCHWPKSVTLIQWFKFWLLVHQNSLPFSMINKLGSRKKVDEIWKKNVMENTSIVCIRTAHVR